MKIALVMDREKMRGKGRMLLKKWVKGDALACGGEDFVKGQIFSSFL